MHKNNLNAMFYVYISGLRIFMNLCVFLSVFPIYSLRSIHLCGLRGKDVDILSGHQASDIN